jgi:hypothetical protein
VRERVPLRVTIERGSVNELLEFLRGLGAEVEREEGNALIVRRNHPLVAGEPPDQDEIELDFILRVWAQRRSVQYEIQSARVAAAKASP